MVTRGQASAFSLAAAPEAVLSAQAGVPLSQHVALPPYPLQLQRLLDGPALLLQELVEGALLLEVVFLRAQPAHPRALVDVHADGAAAGAHRLHGQAAVDPAGAHLDGPDGVGNAAAPLDLIAGIARPAIAHLAQDVVLLLCPQHLRPPSACLVASPLPQAF